MSPTESPKSEDDVAHGSSTQLLRTPVTPKDTGSPATSFGGSIPLPKEEAKRPGESSPSSGGASPLSTTFPMMSEKEFLSRLGNVNLSATKFHYNAEPVKEPIRVLVTAATSELSYLMLIPIARGDVFGLDQPIFLHIYDEGENISDLQGIAMELEDCSFSLLKQVLPTSEDEVAFLNIDVAFLNDGAPTDGDKNLYEQCVQTYVGHGKAFENYAKKTVKVVVSGHPIQTNTFICTKYAKSIPSENFTGLARLNQNRAVTLLSQKLGVIPNKIINMTVWGYKGMNLFPDYSRSVVVKRARRYRITDLVSREYLEEGLHEDVRIRDQLVEKLTKHPGWLSRAKAACDQMRDWWIGLPPGHYVSMAVLSDGTYGVATDVIFTYPVFIDAKRTWKVVRGLTIGEKLRHCIADSSKLLERERDEAVEFCTDLAL